MLQFCCNRGGFTRKKCKVTSPYSVPIPPQSFNLCRPPTVIVVACSELRFAFRKKEREEQMPSTVESEVRTNKSP